MTIAVVVPTFQKRKSLRGLLRSLRNQIFQDFKVIIVDNNEDVEAQNFVDQIISDHNELSIFHVKAFKNLGAGGGRNFGVTSKEAEDCEILAFIDDDCEADEQWLKTIQNHFDMNDSSKIIYGRVTSDILPNPPFIHGFDMKGGVFGSGNCAMKRDFFIKMGGFDTYLNNWAEDFEIGERCKRFETEPIYLKDMLVNHPPKIINYGIKRHILNIEFYKKYIYITKVRKYDYKSPFKRDYLKRSASRLFLFGPFFGLAFFHPLLIVTPFLLSFVFHARKLPSLVRSLNAYPFDEKIKISCLLTYYYFSWLIDILNGGLILIYDSPMLEKMLIEQIEAELRASGVKVDGNTSFL